MTIETKDAKAMRDNFRFASLRIKTKKVNGRVYWYGENEVDGLYLKHNPKTSLWARTSKKAAVEILNKYGITAEQFIAYEKGELEIVEVNDEYKPQCDWENPHNYEATGANHARNLYTTETETATTETKIATNNNNVDTANKNGYITGNSDNELTDREKFLAAKEEIKTTAGRYLGDGKFAQIWQRNNGFGWRNIAKKNAALILAEYGLTVDEYLAAQKQWIDEEVARGAAQCAIYYQAQFLRDKINRDCKPVDDDSEVFDLLPSVDELNDVALTKSAYFDGRADLGYIFKLSVAINHSFDGTRPWELESIDGNITVEGRTWQDYAKFIITDTDGTEDDDFADEMPALYPAEDTDDDDELIDEPELPPADDFATKLAELKAKQDAAKTAELAAKKVYKEASDKYVECQEATQKFLDAHADKLTEKINTLEIESYITMVRNNGKERYDLFDTSQLNVYAFNGFGKMFIVRCRGNELGTYDTPAQVETVIEWLKAAIERGDREFEFPTVEDLTIAEKIAAEKAEHEANQPAEVKALNAELAASKLQAPTMWVKITDGKTGFHFGSFTRGVLSEVRVDYDAVNKYGVFYFDEPMRRYDIFAQVKTAIGQFKTAVINNAKEFTFPTIEELTTPEIDKDATADSLTRAMTIALEHYQDFCRVGNLTAATNELSLYNICRKAMTELLRREAA